MTRLRHLLIVLLFVSMHAFSRRVIAQTPAALAPMADTADAASVVTWIQQTAIPFRSTRAGSGFADLDPLKTVLRDVRVVGLGEATHGTSEFFQVKHRLLEFLVTQMGFTAFAMEAAYSDAQPANDYVLHGIGNRATVQTQLGYVAWDTEEFAAMLEWLRAYNRTVPESRRVRFYGVDLYRNAVGRAKVLAVLRRVASELEARTDSLFRVLAREEERWPLWDTSVVAKARVPLEALVSDLRAKRGSRRGLVPMAEYDDALQLVEVMRQGAAPTGRSGYMGENLLYLLERERSGTKFVFWAHNLHVGTRGEGNAGDYLRGRLGDAYYAVGLDFDHGAYRQRVFPPPGDLKTATVRSAPADSWEWYLARAAIPQFFLDVRPASESPVAERWLRPVRNARRGSWAYQDPADSAAMMFLSLNVRDWYDGILFFAESTPSQPTANARAMVARKAGF
jgi:erythromycin esterase